MELCSTGTLWAAIRRCGGQAPPIGPRRRCRRPPPWWGEGYHRAPPSSPYEATGDARRRLPAETALGTRSDRTANHSQALSARQPESWLLIRRDGIVKLAHCTCMAGLGEVFSHIGAVLYYVKAVSKFNRGQANTHMENIWLPSYIKNVPCALLSSIDFASAKSKKRRLDTSRQPATKKKRCNWCNKPTDQEFASFLKEVSSAEPRAAIFSVTEGYNDELIPTTVRYSSAVLGSLSRDCPKEQDAVIEECQKFSASFAVKEDVCRALEKATRDQAKSTTWFAFRAGRVTASNARSACHTSLTQPSLSLVKRMCYPEASTFSSRATEWVHSKEDVARRQFVSTVSSSHINFECTASGLHICSEYPFLAASFDGVITCECCGKGALEIKCPYTAQCVADVCSGKQGILTKGSGGRLQLNRGHQYFYQVQVQMFATHLRYCAFVMWTVQDCHIERIQFDCAFCNKIANK
ncbi:uncharacterized protein LOC144175895 [Haemaphysalis longicornis]